MGAQVGPLRRGSYYPARRVKSESQQSPNRQARNVRDLRRRFPPRPPPGIALSTSVQADRQGPSMITRWPDCRIAANSRRYEPTRRPRSIRCASQRSRPPVTRREGQKLSSRVAQEVLLVFFLRIKRRAADQIRNFRGDQPLIGDRRLARMRHHLQEARAQLKPAARLQCSA